MTMSHLATNQIPVGTGTKVGYEAYTCWVGSSLRRAQLGQAEGVKRLVPQALAAFFFSTTSAGLLRDPSAATLLAASMRLPNSAAE